MSRAQLLGLLVELFDRFDHHLHPRRIGCRQQRTRLNDSLVFHKRRALFYRLDAAVYCLASMTTSV
jgi:hypothetical protein